MNNAIGVLLIFLGFLTAIPTATAGADAQRKIFEQTSASVDFSVTPRPGCAGTDVYVSVWRNTTSSSSSRNLGEGHVVSEEVQEYMDVQVIDNDCVVDENGAPVDVRTYGSGTPAFLDVNEAGVDARGKVTLNDGSAVSVDFSVRRNPDEFTSTGSSWDRTTASGQSKTWALKNYSSVASKVNNLVFEIDDAGCDCNWKLLSWHGGGVYNIKSREIIENPEQEQ